MTSATEMAPNSYRVLADFYEQCFARHGATHLGMDWPTQEGTEQRFRVMLELISANTPCSLLDLGCGYGALLDYLTTHSQTHIAYTGLDLSASLAEAAKRLHPTHPFITQDVLTTTLQPESYDYIVMNGVLTEKRELSWHAMAEFAKQLICEAFKACRHGIAFNVMSYHVDWCDPRLFYWSFDDVMQFLMTHCSRHVVLRSDYGLYEYTAYVYKQPR